MFSDPKEEKELRKALEIALREGRAQEAEAKVLAALVDIQSQKVSLIDICLSSSVDDISVTAWDRLADAIARYDRPQMPITALGIDMSWPGHIDLKPDKDGFLAPYIETNFYSDSPFPFSSLDRAGVLEGYSAYGSEWQGSFQEIDIILNFDGISQIYGPAYTLQASTRNDFKSLEHYVAVLASCLVAIRIHLAVQATIQKFGLPRPLTVLVGSNEAFPFFDSPVITSSEYSDLNPTNILSTSTFVQTEECLEREFQAIEQPADKGNAVKDTPSFSSGRELRKNLQDMTNNDQSNPGTIAKTSLFNRLFGK